MCVSSAFSLSVAFHRQLLPIYWNVVCLTKYGGRTVGDTNLHVGRLVSRNHSGLENLHCAKVGLHVGGMDWGTI